MGWALPTEHEHELAAGLAQRQPVEVGHDLAYRGVVPRKLTAGLGGSQAAPVRQLITATAEAVGAIRARYMKAAKARVTAALHIESIKGLTGVCNPHKLWAGYDAGPPTDDLVIPGN